MKYENNKVSDIKVCYIGGGSRGWAWKFMTDLAMEPKMSGTVKLYDIDFNAAKCNESIGNKITEMEETVSAWKYEAVSTLEDGLRGADFVIISILPGTFKEMRSDVHYPERYGIYQSVGDTAGPGGMIRALRTIPMYIPIAEGIKKYCKDAWVINYTNPMSLCVKALYKIFPEIKAFGCCHEVFGTQKVLAAVVAKHLGVDAIPRKDIDVNVFGINHFTWFDEASYKGIDIFPIYKKFIEDNFEEGYNDPDRNWMNSSFNCAHRVKFDLFQRYGYIAAAGDRHLAEFMPGNEYLNDPDTVKDWKFGLTTVDWREKDLEERLEKSRKYMTGEMPIDLNPSGEEGILIMKGLLGLERVISNVNLLNTGQISNLPINAVVETNALFLKNSIKPIHVGDMPETLKELTMPHIQNHEYIIDAALTFDKEKVVKAFANDPIIKVKCNEVQIREMIDTMIENTIDYLPSDWKN